MVSRTRSQQWLPSSGCSCMSIALCRVVTSSFARGPLWWTVRTASPETEHYTRWAREISLRSSSPLVYIMITENRSVYHSFGWGTGGKVTSAGWQVTLCDLIWQVISRSGVVISITNCYIRLTYLLIFARFFIHIFLHKFRETTYHTGNNSPSSNTALLCTV